MFINELFSKIRFDYRTDRLGPDIPFTHWYLYFKKQMTRVCKKKFKKFHDSSEFRPGAYAIGCSKISIGERVVIRPTSMLFADTRENGAGIIIEDDVLVGSGVHIYTVNHAFTNLECPIIDQGHDDSKEVILKKGCWIGANVTILPGVIVGRNSVVGAGSVVTKSLPDYVVAVGNPARVIKNQNPTSKNY